MNLTSNQLAAVLAALRLWQCTEWEDIPEDIQDIANETGSPLTAREIDALGEELNA